MEIFYTRRHGNVHCRSSVRGAISCHRRELEVIQMERLWKRVRTTLAWLAARDCPPEAIEAMDLHLRADLPAYHPRRDDGCRCG
jgi:hypothetical protein